MKIIKKNGQVEDFNGDKIIKAINKSAERVCIKLTDVQTKKVVDFAYNKAMLLAKYGCEISEQSQDILLDNELYITVEEMHNIVEVALSKIAPKVAKSYKEFRDNKKIFSDMIDRVYSKKLSLNFIGDHSNANSDSSLVTTQKAIVYNELNSEFYKEFFLTKEERKAMEEGYIYIHDRGSRLDSINCCVADLANILKGGFRMGNLDYSEPKTISVAFDLVGDVILNMASAQYGGYSIDSVDKLLAPYAKLSYDKYIQEYKNFVKDLNLKEGIKEEQLDEYAFEKVKRDIEQGVQGWEMKFNSVASSRGDYPFTSISFGHGTGRFERLISSSFLKVRKEGQGKEGFKRPVLFPKLSFFYDENLHGAGKELEYLFDEAIDCSSKAMYPDFISLTGHGYAPDIYKKYNVTISRMGCRANLSPWYEKGGFEPLDNNDKPIFVGRCNLGAISLHFPMIVAKAKEENKDFYKVLHYYLELCRHIHQRTFAYLADKKAGTNPLAFCQGGLLNGNKKYDERIGEDLLRPMTLSFGITALNEASVLKTGKTIVQDNSFAVEVLKYINDYANKCKKEDKLLYAIYGTPAESLCGLQIQQFRKKYGVIPGVSDREYTTNSFHCGVWEDITPIQKQDIEFPMFHLCNGGNIQYCRYKLGYNKEAIKTLVKRAMKLGFYEGVNLQLDYCEKCGHQFIDNDTCPNCGSTDITRIERMNGYLGYSRVNGRTMYSDHKLTEFKERKSM